MNRTQRRHPPRLQGVRLAIGGTCFCGEVVTAWMTLGPGDHWPPLCPGCSEDHGEPHYSEEPVTDCPTCGRDDVPMSVVVVEPY